MPETTPPTSQLEWLSSTTAMIVLFWSRATRDLLRSFGWGIAALHRENAATKLPFLAARPIASFGSAMRSHRRQRGRDVTPPYSGVEWRLLGRPTARRLDAGDVIASPTLCLPPPLMSEVAD